MFIRSTVSMSNLLPRAHVVRVSPRSKGFQAWVVSELTNFPPSAFFLTTLKPNSKAKNALLNEAHELPNLGRLLWDAKNCMCACRREAHVQFFQ